MLPSRVLKNSWKRRTLLVRAAYDGSFLINSKEKRSYRALQWRDRGYSNLGRAFAGPNLPILLFPGTRDIAQKGSPFFAVLDQWGFPLHTPLTQIFVLLHQIA